MEIVCRRSNSYIVMWHRERRHKLAKISFSNCFPASRWRIFSETTCHEIFGEVLELSKDICVYWRRKVLTFYFGSYWKLCLFRFQLRTVLPILCCKERFNWRPYWIAYLNHNISNFPNVIPRAVVNYWINRYLFLTRFWCFIKYIIPWYLSNCISNITFFII